MPTPTRARASNHIALLFSLGRVGVQEDTHESPPRVHTRDFFLLAAVAIESRAMRGRSNAAQKTCSSCKQLKSRNCFSSTQWERGGQARRCGECIASERRPREPVAEPDVVAMPNVAAVPDVAAHAQVAAADSLIHGLEALPSNALRPHSARLQALLTSAGGLTFGGQASAGGFTFGGEASSAGGFNCGGQASSAGGFNFGGQASAGGFTFGGEAPSAGGFNFGGQASAVVSTAATATPIEFAAAAAVAPEPAEPEDPVKAVLESDELVAIILWHACSLAPLHREYDAIVGFSEVSPQKWDHQRFQELRSGFGTYWVDRRRRWAAAVLVCKSWHELNTGERGLRAWTTMETAAHEARVAGAHAAAADPEYPWLYRLCAMSAANDVGGLRAAIGEPPARARERFAGGERWGAAGLRDAVNELAELDDGCEGLQPGQRPSREQLDRWGAARKVRDRALKRHGGGIFAVPDSYLDSCDISEGGCFEDAILAVCLLNAAMAGAIQAAEFLLRFNDSLWSFCFDQKGNNGFHAAIEYACNLSCLGAPVQGVRAMLSSVRSSPPQHDYLKKMLAQELHRRVRGTDCSALHMAAARGHAPLVRVLVEAGMNRSHLAERARNGSAAQRRATGKTPAEWARLRGHTRVVELLNQRVVQPNRPVRLAIPTGQPGRGVGAAQFGTLIRFEVSKGFGFITPDLDSEDEASDDDYDVDEYDEGRRGDDIFVHLDVLRAAARGSRGYPQPGQRLLFRTQQGRQGLRASLVADPEDGSFLTLSLPNEELARHEWDRYRAYGPDW